MRAVAPSQSAWGFNAKGSSARLNWWGAVGWTWSCGACSPPNGARAGKSHNRIGRLLFGEFQFEIVPRFFHVSVHFARVDKWIRAACRKFRPLPVHVKEPRMRRQKDVAWQLRENSEA